MMDVVTVVVAIATLLMITIKNYDTHATSFVTASVWTYIHPSNKDQTIKANRLTIKFCAKYACRKTEKLGFYNRTHTTSQNMIGGSPTTNGANEGELPATDAYLSSRYSPTSTETAQSGNIESNLVDPDPKPDELIFKETFVSSVVDGGA